MPDNTKLIPTETEEDTRTGYDHVQVPTPKGKTHLLTKSEFEKLPLRERVDFILKGELKFFLDGRPIPPARALKGF
jgi:hypothetical protein